MNITSAIISGSKILRNKFIPSHQLDSEILMAKTIKKDRNYILLNSESVLNKNDLNYLNFPLELVMLKIQSFHQMLLLLKTPLTYE